MPLENTFSNEGKHREIREQAMKFGNLLANQRIKLIGKNDPTFKSFKSTLEAFKEAGCEIKRGGTITSWENGGNFPTEDKLGAIAEIYKINQDELKKAWVESNEARKILVESRKERIKSNKPNPMRQFKSGFAKNTISGTRAKLSGKFF